MGWLFTSSTNKYPQMCFLSVCIQFCFKSSKLIVPGSKIILSFLIFYFYMSIVLPILTSLFGTCSDQGMALDHRLELLRNRTLYKLSILFGDEDVHFWGLGWNDLCVQRLFAQVYMATIGLLNRDGWHNAHHLQERKDYDVERKKIYIYMLNILHSLLIYHYILSWM